MFFKKGRNKKKKSGNSAKSKARKPRKHELSAIQKAAIYETVISQRRLIVYAKNY